MTFNEFTFNGIGFSVLFNKLKVKRVFVKTYRTLKTTTDQPFTEFISPHAIYPIHAKHHANFVY